MYGLIFDHHMTNLITFCIKLNSVFWYKNEYGIFEASHDKLNNVFFGPSFEKLNKVFLDHRMQN